MKFRFAFLIIAALLVTLAIHQSPSYALAQNEKENEKVKLLTKDVEIVEVARTASSCKNSKGQTVKLKVVAENPVDVRLYVKASYKMWLTKDFPNQKKGDEITDYRCLKYSEYKVYSHNAGDTTEWAKP